MDATKTLSHFFAETDYETFPVSVVEAAKVAILDGVANMLAGSTQELAGIIGRYVQDLGGGSSIFRSRMGIQNQRPVRRFRQRRIWPLPGFRDSRIPANPRYFFLSARSTCPW